MLSSKIKLHQLKTFTKPPLVLKSLNIDLFDPGSSYPTFSGVASKKGEGGGVLSGVGEGSCECLRVGL